MQQIESILLTILTKITDQTDVIWAGYNSPAELRKEIELNIEQLKAGNEEALQKFNIMFAPTSVFQELAQSNGWHDEYMKLAREFDERYEVVKTRSRIKKLGKRILGYGREDN
ncbi:MAG: hypothetical protein EP346_08395 [Bacteroidetes bacterium]|nr:MAG: hypothetical protein EP346_08395 [Bacteroidota bacterium]